MLACMEQAPDTRYVPLAERLPDVRMQRAVEGMRVHGNPTAAARFAGVDRRTVRRWMETDQAFAEEMAEAREEHADLCEEELHRRAFLGDEQVQYHKGQPVYEMDDEGNYVLDENFEKKPYVRRIKSDVLVVPYLKSKRATYRDKTDLTLMGPDGGPVKTDSTVTINLVHVKPVDLEAKEREFLARQEAEEARGEEA